MIGFGLYISHPGTWPVIHFIRPIILISIGVNHFQIHGIDASKIIDFTDGDKFIDLYPFWVELRNEIVFQGIELSGIGPVCGIWIDKR